MTPTIMFTNRDAAGADYAAKLAALKASWIALRAYDIACANSLVLQAHPTAAMKVPVRTFANASEWNGSPLLHPVFTGSESVAAWDATAHATAQTYVDGLN